MSQPDTLTFEEIPGEPPWLYAAVSAVLVAIGCVLYELTARPEIGVVAACATFGWNDLRIGWWLWRRDPWKNRGRACGVFHLASALWKVTMTGVCVGIPLLMLNNAVNPRPQPALVAYVPMYVAFVCFALLSMTALAGMIIAGCSGVRVWLDPEVHWSRREKLWPPQHFSYNRLPRLLLTAMIPPFLLITMALIWFYVWIAPAGGIGLLSMATMLGGPIGLLYVRQLALNKLSAAWPGQSWPEHTGEPTPAADAAQFCPEAAGPLSTARQKQSRIMASNAIPTHKEEELVR